MGIGISGANNGYSRNVADTRFAKLQDNNQSISAGLIYSNDGIISPSYQIDSTLSIVAADDVRSWVGSSLHVEYDFGFMSPSPSELVFSSNGLILYVVSGNSIYQYELGTPWEISSIVSGATYTLTLSSVDVTSIGGLAFSSDGSYMFIGDNATLDKIHRYELGTPWEISSIVSGATYTLTLSDITDFPSTCNISCIQFSSDGNYMFILDDYSNEDTIYQIALVSSWSIEDTPSLYASIDLAVTPFFSFNGRSICFNDDGTKLFYTSSSNGCIYELSLSSPYNINSYSFKRSAENLYSVIPNVVTSINYNENSGKLYVSCADNITYSFNIIPKLQINDFSDNYISISKLVILDQNINDPSFIVNGLSSLQNINCSTLNCSTLNSYTINSSTITVDAASYLNWDGRARLYSPADNRITLTGNSGSGSGFDLLQFGGVGGGFPAIKRSGTALQVKLATDTDFTNIEAASFVVNNNILTKNADFTLSQTDAGKYMRLTKTGSTQTITLPTTGINTGAEFQFFRSTSQSLAFAGSATVNGSVNLSAVSQNSAFALKYLGSGIYDFV